MSIPVRVTPLAFALGEGPALPRAPGHPSEQAVRRYLEALGRGDANAAYALMARRRFTRAAWEAQARPERVRGVEILALGQVGAAVLASFCIRLSESDQLLYFYGAVHVVRAGRSYRLAGVPGTGSPHAAGSGTCRELARAAFQVDDGDALMGGGSTP